MEDILSLNGIILIQIKMINQLLFFPLTQMKNILKKMIFIQLVAIQKKGLNLVGDLTYFFQITKEKEDLINLIIILLF